MREIKFRAWDKTSKQMFYPHYIQWAINGAYRISAVGMRWTREKEYLPLGLRTSMKIKRIELMPFTGLKDKNGKEIYEGDIVNWTSWKIGFKHIDGSEVKLTPKVVQWVDGAWKLEEDSPWNLSIYDNVEVIGNIYENGDLLK